MDGYNSKQINRWVIVSIISISLLFTLIFGVFIYRIFYDEALFPVADNEEITADSPVEAVEKYIRSEVIGKTLREEDGIGLFINRYDIILCNKLKTYEGNAVIVEFSMDIKTPDMKFFDTWGNRMGHKIECQWVLWYNHIGNGTYNIELVQKSSDAFPYISWQNRMVGESPFSYLDTEDEYTWKISDGAVRITYGRSEGWIELPLSIDELLTVGDGNSDYSKVPKGSYFITEDKTAFIYGGTYETPLSVIYSDDKGKTWNTGVIDETITSARVRFIGQITEDELYGVCTSDRVVRQEMHHVFRSYDGGKTWEKTFTGDEYYTWMVNSVCFINSDVAFIAMGGGILRSGDGGYSFELLEINYPETVIDENSPGKFEFPFTEVFSIPAAPFYDEDGNLSLYVEQEPGLGDFMGGNIAAKFISTDLGETWEYDKLEEPPEEYVEPG